MNERELITRLRNTLSDLSEYTGKFTATMIAEQVKLADAYLAAPAAPALVPLTDERIEAAWENEWGAHMTTHLKVVAFARAIEAAHGIKP